MYDKVIESLGYLEVDEDVKKKLISKMKACTLYLKNAGVDIEKESEDLIECIAIGVNDLLNEQSGKTEFSPAFKTFALQLASM